MFRTQQIRIDRSISAEMSVALVVMGQSSNSLENSVTYKIRQDHFENLERRTFFDAQDNLRSEFPGLSRVKLPSTFDVQSAFKDNAHYKLLGGQQGQQTISKICESFRSFNGLLGPFFRGELNGKPRLPNYRKPGGLSIVTFPAQALRWNLETGECKLPVSRELAESVKEQIGELWIPGGYGFSPSDISEVRILFRNGCIYAEYCYKCGNEGPSCRIDLNHSQGLGIDQGGDNWLTCVSTLGKSFIIDGRKLKALNQWRNKQVAKLKEGKPQGFWSSTLAEIEEKRNRQMRDAINKAARFIVNHCLENKLGWVVFGWNTGVKDGSKMSKKTNQNYIQIPTAKLKARLEQLCSEHGIQFFETEEAYTSKASFLDADPLPKYGEKPVGLGFSGKRGTRKKGSKYNPLGRGDYLMNSGEKLNSDANAAANILRKVSVQLGLDLARIVRGSLTAPKRYDLFSDLSRSYRKRCEAEFTQA
jgi:putative transposase